MEKRYITKESINKVLKCYWEQYKSHPMQSLFAFLLPSIGSILVFFVPPLILGKIINTFVTLGSVSLSSVLTYIVILGIAWMAGEALWRIGMHNVIILETRGIKRLNMIGFNWLAERDYDFYTNHFVGSLTKKALAFSRNFEVFTDTLLFNVFTNFFPFVFVIIVLWQYSPIIPLILIVCFTIVILIALPIIRGRSKLVAERHDASSRMVGRLSDTLTNISAVKSFAKEEREYSIYEGYVDIFAKKFKNAYNYHNLKFEMILAPLYVITNMIGLVSSIIIGQKLHLQPGTIVIVFSYYASLTRIFWEINRTYRNIEASISESAEFAQMFLTPPGIIDTQDAKNLEVSDALISFNHVDFKYSDTKNEFEEYKDKKEDEEDIKESFMSNFELHVKSNQKVGLVGPSGGGKSTITKLLLRFADVQAGSITIDGQDISRVTQKSLRDAIAYVPQEPILFHRSLFENIAYGNENATKEEVMKASKLAHADEFISGLPDGYETLVGERGVKLSGGQRQRIAIARALVKNAPILILDEATSALDSESEKYIQEGLAELMKNKTTLVIAHRLSTIKHLDRIIVLDNGQIVQDGTHEQLTKKKTGIYAKLWSHQSGEFMK
jgi:ATP-binding cassette subfamily B protein